MHCINLLVSCRFDKVKNKIDAISKVQPERLLEHAKVENKMYNLLKEEQKEKYKESYRNTER